MALHQRQQSLLRDPIVIPEHMPQAHRKYLSYNADDFTLWAQSIGQNTSEVVRMFLESGKEPEQGFKFCASLMKLGEKYGSSKLEKACEQILKETLRELEEPSQQLLNKNQYLWNHLE